MSHVVIGKIRIGSKMFAFVTFECIHEPQNFRRWSLSICLLSYDVVCVSVWFLFMHSWISNVDHKSVQCRVLLPCTEMHMNWMQPFEWIKFLRTINWAAMWISIITVDSRRSQSVPRTEWKSLASLDANTHSRPNSDYSNSEYFTFCINFHFHRVKFTMSYFQSLLLSHSICVVLCVGYGLGLGA